MLAPQSNPPLGNWISAEGEPPLRDSAAGMEGQGRGSHWECLAEPGFGEGGEGFLASVGGVGVGLGVFGISGSGVPPSDGCDK